MTRLTRLTVGSLLAPFLAAPPAARAQTPAITEADLRARLGAVAHDSMGGRAAGGEGHRRTTAYLAAELARLGLRPAGDSGTFLQRLPFATRRIPPNARLTLGDSAYTPWEDFAVLELSPATRSLDGAAAVFGGTVGAAGDSLLAGDAAAGRLVVFAVPPGATVQTVGEQVRDLLARYRSAAGIAVMDLYRVQPQYVAQLRAGQTELDTAAARPLSAPTPVVLTLGARASDALRSALASARVGASLGTVRGDVRYRSDPAPSYNVVAVLPGADPRLAGQYVAVGAHSDHVGYQEPVDHDSLRAYNQALVDAGAEDPFSTSPAQQAAARRAADSLLARRGAGRARPDSIRNGADDDGSGTTALLEVAEQMATAREKPKRSVLFVWHTAEELGMVGSAWFTDRPTVPLDSIVAQVNVDMIGRGGARDIARLGGPGYLQLIGSRRLSTELGDLVEATNAEGKHGFTFDYRYDAPGHPQQYYCRSDHYMYARFGIPIVFMSTGGHADYHQVTDEPQHIDYAKLARVARFIGDVARRVADLDHRVAVDKPKPDPSATCVQ